MKTKPLPSQSFLAECFRYDPETGSLFWRCRPDWHFPCAANATGWNKRLAGTRAGSPSAGAILCEINSDSFLAHRIIWKLVHNEEPPEIDHINGKRHDNRLCNLRAATRTLNCRNMSRRRDNTSGVTGVTWNAKRGVWHARIRRDGKYCHLGSFASLDEAREARRAAEAELDYHRNHGREKASG